MRVASVLFATVVLLSGLSCDKVGVTHYYKQGVAVTVSPLASEIGKDVLISGGNAFDAAVAVGFALAVTYPPAGNLGGGGFAVMRYDSTGEIRALDFRETAPIAASRNMFLDSTGAVIKNLSTRGALAAGVPGTVAGLHALWERYGTRPWQDLVTIAARLADSGFIVDRPLAKMFAEYDSSLTEFEETRGAFLPNGALPRQGDRLIQPDLARTLYAIASGGPAGFYAGPTADSIVACMTKYGGLITRADLDGYHPVWRQPLHFTFDSLDVYSMPPPSSGGIIVGQILKLLEPYDFSQMTPSSPEFIHLFCEACRLAYADRSKHLGDPDFFHVPTTLLNSNYLNERRKLIPRDHAGNSAEVQPGNPGKYESDATTHFSICDQAGNMVAITYTINEFFGSGLTVGGAGFLLNNEMDDFAIRPGYANTWGLVGDEANCVEANKRMLSSMSPTLVLRDKQPFLILGSAGGSKIITTVAQAIIDITRFGMTPQAAVAAPRFHHQWLPDSLYLEKKGFDAATIQKLLAYGHQVRERTPYGDLELIQIVPTGMM
ncbi:MAG: gamma-glutamyltransferase, partial [candidate division Zixibacteria bacterium]|nr:gamma-glutamyltransferase [candidate division Zixibacteria bacterium]